jgi:hypothetical protein
MPARHILALAVMTVAAGWLAAADEGGPRYALNGTLVLGGKGRCEAIACDTEAHRLYLSRTDHLEIVDTAGLVLAEVPCGLRLRQLAFARAASGDLRAFISDWAGAVQLLDLPAFQVQELQPSHHAANPLGAIPFPGATGVVAVPDAGEVFAFAHDTRALLPLDAGLAGLSGGSATSAMPAPIPLDGTPAAAVASALRHRLYIGCDDRDTIAVLATDSDDIVAHFPLGAGHHPTGLAVDDAGGRLFASCADRHLLVLDLASGALLGDLPTGAGPGDCAFSAGSVLVACGDGTLTVARPAGPGGYVVTQTLVTTRGARFLTLDAHGVVYLPADLYPPGSGDPGQTQPLPDSLRLIMFSRLPQL